MEKLSEEFSILQDRFHFPNLDRVIYEKKKKKHPHGNHKLYENNSTVRVELNSSHQYCSQYEEFMSQLTELEVDLLYTAYYNDFELFSYDVSD